MRGEERLRPTFFAGFAVAMAGICLISFNGSALELGPPGGFAGAAGCLRVGLLRPLVPEDQRPGPSHCPDHAANLFLRLAFMLPALMVSGVRLELTRLTAPVNLGNLLFLGLGASALCFVTWNFAVKALGAVKTSVYIYLVPVITVAASVLILREPFTWMTGAGTVLTLIGLLLSEGKLHWKEGTHHETGTGQMRPGVDEAMPRGLAANTAAILGITWGRLRPELVGEDVTDAAGAIHPGIIRTPVRCSRQAGDFSDPAAAAGRAGICRCGGCGLYRSGPELPYLRRVHRKRPAPGRGSCDTWAWPFWAPGIRWTG